MIATSFWVCWLALRRDKAALLLTFILPPLLFLAFAAIFADSTGRDLKLKVAVADLAHSATTTRLADALGDSRVLRLLPVANGTAADVADLVRRGAADVGLVMRADLAAPGSVLPLDVVAGADRPLATTVLLGQVQQVMGEHMPDVMLARMLADLGRTGALPPPDRAALGRVLARVAAPSAASPPGSPAAPGSTPAPPAPAGLSFASLAATVPASGAAQGHAGVLQYAAAVAAMFLLFGAVQTALGLIDERAGGIADRLRLVPGGLGKAMVGRFLFLLAQGTAQVALVYGTAFVVYGATFDVALVPFWLAAAAAAAAACAGLALFACAASRSRKQAELWTTFAVLLLSALGGSMVPRYLMPAWLQQASWLTPNAWIMQALTESTLPGVHGGGFALTLAVLGAIAAAGCALAATFA